MSERAPLVIIGTGLAGYNLAREWRKLDGETPLLMITIGKALNPARPRMGLLSFEEAVSMDRFGNHALQGEVDDS